MEKILSDIENDGYTIIPSLVPAEMCLKTKGAINKWLLDYCSVDVAKIEPGVKHPNFPSYKHGIISNYGVSHLQEIWDLRCYEPIRDVFAYLYTEYEFLDAEDLLVSMDAINVQYPYNDRSLARMKTSAHLDQTTDTYSKPWKGYEGPALTSTSFHSLQGFVTLIDMYANESGTFRCMVGSHRYHADIVKRMDPKEKWYAITDEDYSYVEKKLKAEDRKNIDIRIPEGSNNEVCNNLGYVPAGSLVVWSSQLIHSGCVPKMNVPLKDRKWRYICYLSYQPRSLCSSANLRKRIKAFEELRMTTHLCSNPRLFPKNPDSRHDKRDHIKYYDVKPKLDEIGRKLVGYNV